MIPKLKSDELMDYINSILVGESPMSHLPEIESQVRKLESSQYGLAKFLLGMIASLRGDISEIDKQFNAALKYTGNDLNIQFNYAKALDNGNQQRRAISLMHDLVDQYPDDVEILQQALKLNVQAFNYEGATQIFEKLNKLGIEPKIPYADYSALVSNVPQILESKNLNWEDVTERIEMAGQHLQDLGIVSRKARQYADEESMFFEFFILGNSDEANNTERSLLDFLSSKPYSPVDEVIAFGCLPE